MTDRLFNLKNITPNVEKEKIIEILDEWNFWSKTPDCGILRERYLQQFEKMKATQQVVFITGVRRSGKSTLMKQHIKRMIDEGEDRKNSLYINFEEPKFIDELSVQFLIDAFDAYLEIVQPTSTPDLFLDEIQHIKGWERFVRALHEKGSANIFVSGSSARLLSKELGTALTGRHIDIHVYPLTFREFLEFNNLKLETKLDIVTNKLKIRQMMRKYLSSGGFPLVVLLDGNNEILRDYFNDIILRDIAERYKVIKVDKLRSLAKYYLTNIGAPSSFRKIANFIGISLDSVERYSYHLSDAYLIFFVKKFSYSLKEQEINPRKVYAIDPGLRNIVSFKFSEDLGKLYENTVFLELYRRGEEVYYYQGRHECDFVVMRGQSITQAFQVCYSLTEQNREREIAGLLEAMDEFELSEGTIITDDVETVENYGDKSIRFVALWKWLLD
ncbi:MAG: ATP-binding protein [Methanosarcinales archaeon]|nr:ATP-binding protein [Methanosarcinales archaeon]